VATLDEVLPVSEALIKGPHQEKRDRLGGRSLSFRAPPGGGENNKLTSIPFWTAYTPLQTGQRNRSSWTTSVDV